MINIIVNSDDYATNSKGQVAWAGVVYKKGKRMGLYTPRFFVLKGIQLLLYRSPQNWENSEEPTKTIDLLNCDFSQRVDKKDILFRKKKPNSTTSTGHISPNSANPTARYKLLFPTFFFCFCFFLAKPLCHM